MAITIKDLARESGVNTSTVSRALNSSYGVNAETKKLVLAVAERLGYRPNRVARGLVTGKSHTFAVIVSDIRNSFFAEVARGAEDMASKAGFDLILCNSDLDADKQIGYVDSLMAKRVDGIMMNSVAALSVTQQEQLAGCGVPIVLMNRAAPKHKFSTVCSDYLEGGVLAADYLLELGHRHVAHLTGPRHNFSLSDRAEGFRSTLQAAKHPVEPVIMHGKNSFGGSYQLTKTLLEARPDITAIFTANDSMAFGAVKAIIESGRRIPDDISVVGFDDVELASVIHPPLSTIRQPKYEMGCAAVEILLRLSAQGPQAVPEHRLFGVELIRRQSCRSLLQNAPSL